jgi:hypothetical protein
MARPAMPSREHYGDVLQLRPDLWRAREALGER